MIRLETRLRLQRPARDCLWFVTDFRNLPLWDASVTHAEKITEGALGAGARFELRLRAGGRERLFHYEILRFAPPFAATLRGEAEGATVVDEIRIDADPDGNSAVLHWSVEVRLARPLHERLLRPLLQRNVRRAARALQKALANEPEPRLGPIGRLGDALLLPGAARFTRQGYFAARLQPVTDRADDRHIVITGATSGIGEAAAITLARRGARLTLVGRDPARLAALRRRLRIDSGATARCVEADLLDLDATRAAAEALRALPPVDVLINNAGALFSERATNPQGIERALAVNLLAPLELIEAAAPVMAEGGRIINVVTGGMYLTPLRLDDLQSSRGRYDGAAAYGRAKRALAVLSQHRARQWPHLVAHNMHPGWADTPGVQQSLPAFRRIMRPFLRSAEEGADTIVWLALSPRAAAASDGVWLDRRPHPLDVLPATRLNAEQIDALDGQIRALVGSH